MIVGTCSLCCGMVVNHDMRGLDLEIPKCESCGAVALGYDPASYDMVIPMWPAQHDLDAAVVISRFLYPSITAAPATKET